MNLFQKFFGGIDKDQNKSIEHNEHQISGPPKNKQTVFDFFQLDFKSIPDESFNETSVETNTSGVRVVNFSKSLKYKECGIFDTIEIKIIGDKKIMNAFLKSYTPNEVKINLLKVLIDDLYSIYGNDHIGRGAFTKQDIENYHSKEFNVMFGRRWLDYTKYEFPVGIDRDEDEICFSIFGVGTR